jgi:UDP-3-O-[3-hydroxymyristoyl] glucosamine N-acyltransferase
MDSTFKYTVSNVIPYLGKDYQIIGDPTNFFFTNIKPSFEADENSLAWISHVRKDRQELFKNCNAKVIICDNTIKINAENLIEKCIIIVSNPRLTFTKILNSLFLNENSYCEKGKIHPSAVVHREAKIHDSVTIGPFNIIGKCEIEEGAYIGAHNVIFDNVFIGKNVRINEFNLIGGAGLGFVRDDDASLIKMAHIGSLIIEEEVEIFTHVNIDRGTISETRVKKGAKIDHHVHLSHNTVVGEHSIIVAHSVLCGGSQVGDRAWVGVGSIIKDSMKVGNDTIVGLGTVVTKNVPDNEIWAGNPGQRIEDLIAIQKKIKNL